MQSAMSRLLPVALFATLAFACARTAEDSAPSSAGASGTQVERDSCALLTADDIQSVMGKAPGPPKPDANGCSWPAADGSNEFLVQLVVAGTTIRSYDDYRKESDGAADVHRIEAPGEFAIAFNDMPMVQIFSGGSFVQVSTFRNEEKHAVELAKRAHARLPR